jgi:hypothetical protein
MIIFKKTIKVTEEEAQWFRNFEDPKILDDELKKVLALEGEMKSFPGEYFPAFHVDIENDKVVLSSDIKFIPEHLSDVLQSFLNKFRKSEKFLITWAQFIPYRERFNFGYIVVTANKSLVFDMTDHPEHVLDDLIHDPYYT